MSPTPIPFHEIGLDLHLSLVLLSLSPAMLVSWLQTRFPSLERWLPIGWYGVVLLAITVASFYSLGTPPRLLTAGLPLWLTISFGLLLGGVAIGIDLVVSRAFSRAASNRPRIRSPTLVQRRRFSAPVADIPSGTEIAWRLHSQGSSWRNGLGSLLLAAGLEECLYRQALLGLLYPVFGGLVIPALISTACFGLIHIYYGMSSVLSKWIIGAIFAGVVLAGVSLATVVLAHMVLNSAAYAHRTRSLKETSSF